MKFYVLKLQISFVSENSNFYFFFFFFYQVWIAWISCKSTSLAISMLQNHSLRVELLYHKKERKRTKLRQIYSHDTKWFDLNDYTSPLPKSHSRYNFVHKVNCHFPQITPRSNSRHPPRRAKPRTRKKKRERDCYQFHSKLTSRGIKKKS